MFVRVIAIGSVMYVLVRVHRAVGMGMRVRMIVRMSRTCVVVRVNGSVVVLVGLILVHLSCLQGSTSIP